MSYKMYPMEFLDELMMKETRELYSKIEVLDWKERPIGEIQGRVTDGNVTIDGTSAIRRTLSLSMFVDETNYNITALQNEVSLNKKIKVHIGMANTSIKFAPYGHIIWFPQGVFVLTDGSIMHTVEDNSLSITAQDKMCLLSGDVGGTLQGPVDLGTEDYLAESGEVVKREIVLYEIIKFAVIGLGGEDPAKVIINDVPLTIREPLKYEGDTLKFFDINNNEVGGDSENIHRVLEPGDYAGYRLRDFCYPTEFIKQAGDSVSSILEDIRGYLGNFEYYYDVDGNFIFQETKNYMNTMFTPITQLSNGEYMADFQKVPYIYSLKGKGLATSFNNTPDWKNIKNDFVVWGMSSSGSPIHYHLAIDDKPYLPPSYDKPWQQFLVEFGDTNTNDPGTYYQELKAKLPQIYDATTNEWKSDPSEFNYWLDIIDAKSDMGKFSVNTIGRRTKAISDENVTIMYPPEIPDVVIIPQGSDNADIADLVKMGAKFQIVDPAEYGTIYSPTGVGKDAFTVIRELLYFHTTFNEVVNITCLPIYFLEANYRIEAEDKRSNVYGDYIIKSMSIPLGAEGLMTINAIRVTSRI